MPGPLAGIRVLDLTRVLAGPWAAQNLADLGAEVIKVERPKKGDDSRAFGPPWLKDAQGRDTAESAYFACANRGKKSVTLDLANPKGQAIARELAERCDVLLENFKYGDLDRYGLGYAQLRKVNPGLIYCSVTGFGHSGPWRERPGYDFMIQGMGGLMSVTGERDDRAGGGPQKAGIPIADLITGMYASVAICAALAHRAKSGLGQHLDLALLDSLVAVLANQGANYLATGTPPGRLGNDHPNIAPYQVLPTSDGSFIVACGNDNLFGKFSQVIGRPELAADARFASNGKRVANRAELTRIISEITAKRSMRHWLDALEGAGVPCGPINNLEQVFAEPQAMARGLRMELPHPTAGKVALTRSPMRFSETPVQHEMPPPTLGQHTNEVLRELLGKSEAEVARLRSDGIV
ncbi:MAG TPA: CaiB/BaiF CoA-transferase family protein [Burkholderiales bacterium]|nr:CaiB/BaiF CoA-transferase family protein [Burkholderiales bacterium]